MHGSIDNLPRFRCGHTFFFLLGHGVRLYKAAWCWDCTFGVTGFFAKQYFYNTAGKLQGSSKYSLQAAQISGRRLTTRLTRSHIQMSRLSRCDPNRTWRAVPWGSPPSLRLGGVPRRPFPHVVSTNSGQWASPHCFFCCRHWSVATRFRGAPHTSRGPCDRTDRGSTDPLQVTLPSRTGQGRFRTDLSASA